MCFGILLKHNVSTYTIDGIEKKKHILISAERPSNEWLITLLCIFKISKSKCRLINNIGIWAKKMTIYHSI